MKATHLLVTDRGFGYHAYYNEKSKHWHAPNEHEWFDAFEIHSLTPLEPSKPQEPETFDWKAAMRLFLDGVEIQGESYANNWRDWHPRDNDDFFGFQKNIKYRIKPKEPVVKKKVMAVRDDYISPFEWPDIEIARREQPSAQAFLEITFHDGKPVSVRLIGKDEV